MTAGRGGESPFPAGFFRRMDESPDPLFYEMPRKVVHIDDGAISQVSRLYEELVPQGGHVLDLMSSWRTHMPDGHAGTIWALGMNEEELADNPQLDAYVVKDLNADPSLPYDDATFDAATCCVSVQYMTRPLEIFAEVARVLRPGAPFVLTFSNRCFPPKAIAGWMYSGDAEHIRIVQTYFSLCPGFDDPRFENRSTNLGDPLYCVWAPRAS